MRQELGDRKAHCATIGAGRGRGTSSPAHSVDRHSNFRGSCGHYLGVTSYSEIGDAELVSMAARDPDAFGELFKRHSRSVYAYCARRTGDLNRAEDLTSVVFLEAFRHRRKLQLSNTSALPWLLGVANNVTRNADRAVRRYRSALDRVPPPAGSASSEDEVIDHLRSQEALARAVEALRPLTQVEREVVLLVLWSELSYADAAASLGIPIGTVRSRLASARHKFSHAAAITINPTF
jgi:RNA polymerase sigma-70 factor, ECF subfamily